MWRALWSPQPFAAVGVARWWLWRRQQDEAVHGESSAPAPGRACREGLLATTQGGLWRSTGLAAEIVVFSATAFYLLRDPHPGFNLTLLAPFFFGVFGQLAGAFIGAAWGDFQVSSLLVLAFSRNLLVGITLFIVRRRAEWDQTKDFLDHL